MRVTELAHELGISAKELMAKLTAMGQIVRTASTGLEPPVVARLRREFGTPGPGPVGSSQRPQPRPTEFQGLPDPRPRRNRSRREWWRGGDIAPLPRAILDTCIVPERRPDDPIPAGRYYADEVNQASAVADKWKDALFDGLGQERILEWLHRFPMVSPKQALEFERCDIGPHEASLRLWYGVVRSDRRALFDRVYFNDMTMDEAAEQVRRYRARSA